MPDASQWLRKLGALDVSRSKAKGPAPNKPLLVLTILDLAEEGLIGPDGFLRKDSMSKGSAPDIGSLTNIGA